MYLLRSSLALVLACLVSLNAFAHPFEGLKVTGFNGFWDDPNGRIEPVAHKPGAYEFRFEIEGHALVYEIPEAITRQLLNLIERPDGPWAFFDDPAETACEEQLSISLGRFAGELEFRFTQMSPTPLGRLRVIEGSFQRTILPTGAPDPKLSAVNADILRMDRQGTITPLVFLASPSDGGFELGRMKGKIPPALLKYLRFKYAVIDQMYADLEQDSMREPPDPDRRIP